MMHLASKVIVLFVILQVCFAPPVTKKKEGEEETQPDGLEDYIEYHRYIREVVNALESDATFRAKLENANEDEIRSGRIANELELVAHNVRSRLDEIKRNELERLRKLTAKKAELLDNNYIDEPSHHHIDHVNPHTFEIEDLRKLIRKTTEDLAEADRKRRDEFKQYELQKEYERQQQLNHTTDEERKKLEEQHQDMIEKHKKHQKLHTPGHKQQIEEVWQEQDHMQQDFNPKVFFTLHDLDSNGLWDQNEVKALFVKELDKMYAAGAPEDDMRERVEEMERMRESVFQEMDTDRDGFINYKEFLHQTQKNDYEKDPGWQGLDEQRPYTDEELQEYIRQHQMQYPPSPHGYGYHPNDVNAQMYPPGQYPPHPQQGYHAPPPPHHGQHPQAYHQPPPQGYHGQQMPPHQQQAPHPAQGQYPPQGQMHHQQMQHHSQQAQMPHGQQAQMPHGQQAHMPNVQQHAPPMQQQGHPPPPAEVHQANVPPAHGEFHPGQLPQVQVNPQPIHHAQGVNPPVNAAASSSQPQANTNQLNANSNQHQQAHSQNSAPSAAPVVSDQPNINVKMV